VGAAAGAARALSSRTHEQPSTSRLPGDDEDRERDDSDEREPVRTAGSRRREKRQGAQVGDARRVAGQAREALREIAGTDAESVSSLTREGGHWCVTLEVVEVRRVPDSTDVLASYAVHLDDDGSLVSFERVRRYYRSQAGEERE
jgi:hypothetical protein